ncbi:hypothetical protein CC79DRAFT_157712 [Sarocladium strictum]
MADQSPQSRVMQARRSCQFCARRKIRCSKELPICSSCTTHQRKCIYDKRALPEDLGSQEADRQILHSLARPPPRQRTRDDYRSSIRFLDHGVFLRTQGVSFADQPISQPVPNLIHTLVGDRDAMHETATYYFRAASPWLPIVSKRRVFDQLLNPLLSPLRADTYFLLLCMLVITQPSPVEGLCSEEYHAATQFRAELEVSGALSLNILQGCIMLAVYEQGNAIYPAAHLSVGGCLKQATALGLGWTYSWPDSHLPAEQVRAEERRRVWWAIYLLERIQTLGNQGQILLVPEPDLGAQLPWSEAGWDECKIPTSPSTLSSPSSRVGRYSAIIQASFLLSNVYAHLSHSFTDKSSQQREVKQLQNTLDALMRYTIPEGSAELKVLCYFRAIGTAAKLILLEPYIHSSDDPSFLEYARSAMDDTLTSTFTSADAYVQLVTDTTKPGVVSPFILPWLYIAAKKCILDDKPKDLALLETAIAKLSWRWKAADSYTNLLAAFKVMHS